MATKFDMSLPETSLQFPLSYPVRGEGRGGKSGQAAKGSERGGRQGRQEGRRREATHDGLTDKWLASRTAFILSYTLGGGDGSLMLLHVRMTIRGLCTL